MVTVVKGMAILDGIIASSGRLKTLVESMLTKLAVRSAKTSVEVGGTMERASLNVS